MFLLIKKMEAPFYNTEITLSFIAAEGLNLTDKLYPLVMPNNLKGFLGHSDI